MLPLDLLHQFPGLAIRDIAVTPDLICLAAESTAPTAACPACGIPSDHVHSRYTRAVADLPGLGRRVVLRLTVRRFRCRTPNCPRLIFCERLPDTAAHARTTVRLTAIHRLVGLALGGEAGSRLTDHLAAPTSPDTVLRRVKAATPDATPPPRVVGIDDWAWRKGQRYGTIVVDLERRRVIDLLPDRDAETVKRWLAAHPGVEVVSRDRWSAYAQAAAEAAPHATQVADRWHLLKNLREAVERLFERHAGLIGEGCTNAAQLHRELLARSVRASPVTVRRFVTKRLAAVGTVRDRVNAARPAARVPTPRQLSFEWVRRPERRPADEQARIDAVRGVGGEVAAGLNLADGFADLVRERTGGDLGDWLAEAEESSCAEVRAFAAGVRRDEGAVRAAVTTAWSNGQVEGQVGRLKLIKRSGYGRAGFELLRVRVLSRV